MQYNAFARSRAMFAAISTIMASASSAISAQTQIDALGEYKPRGHGGRHPPKSAKKQRRLPVGKYAPHQGVKERSRRIAQGFTQCPLLIPREANNG